MACTILFLPSSKHPSMYLNYTYITGFHVLLAFINLGNFPFFAHIWLVCQHAIDVHNKHVHRPECLYPANGKKRVLLSYTGLVCVNIPLSLHRKV